MKSIEMGPPTECFQRLANFGDTRLEHIFLKMGKCGVERTREHSARYVHECIELISGWQMVTFVVLYFGLITSETISMSSYGSSSSRMNEPFGNLFTRFKNIERRWLAVFFTEIVHKIGHLF